MPEPVLTEALVGRFRSDLERIGAVPARLALAVSGGPDSLALLALATAALPGRVIAATVDHGLRAESGSEAHHVATLCAQIGVPHAILTPAWDTPPIANIQAEARTARYDVLAGWAVDQGVTVLATGHHQDDQAETLLLRLARGSGSAGLAGVRPSVAMGEDVVAIRPLLGWRKAELETVVAACGWTPVRDPSNASPDYDRTRARALLAETDWLDPARLAAAASHLGEVEAALAWATGRLFAERAERDGDTLRLDAEGLPAELQRRLLLAALAAFGVNDPPGPKVVRLLAALAEGRTATLGTVRVAVRKGRWHFAPAAPRRPLASGTPRT